MTSINRAWLVLSPIVLFLGAQFGAPLIAGAAPGAFVFTLAITSFVVTGVLTWASVRAERLVVPRVVDHLRQASLLYVSAAVGLVLRFSSSVRGHWLFRLSAPLGRGGLAGSCGQHSGLGSCSRAAVCRLTSA